MRQERSLPAAPALRRRVRAWGMLLGLVALMALPCESVRGQDAGDADGPADRLPGGAMLRGKVTVVTASAITMRSETGEPYQVTATTNTRIMRDRQPIKLADIRPGDGIGAGGVMDAPKKTLHAVFIAVIDAEQVRKAEAELGKSYILGHIHAIDELKLTIQRPDGVKQVIAVDEGTSFRRGGGRGLGGPGPGTAPATAKVPDGESITLADLKIGDSIAARGALKAGVFVPTELHVFDPNRQRHHGTQAGAAVPESHP